MTTLRSDTSSNVRVAALKALQALKVPNMDEVMKVAVADSEPIVRRAALGILPSLSMSDAAKVQSLVAVIRGGSVADQQAGFDVLGTLTRCKPMVLQHSPRGSRHIRRRRAPTA